jgi:alpha-mannosidase
MRITLLGYGLLVTHDASSRLTTRDPLIVILFMRVLTCQVLRANRKLGAPMDVVIHATGHAHIDVAWLWTLRGQTRRKSDGHSRDPADGAIPSITTSRRATQVYQFIQEDQPAFESIKEKVKEGRWEPIGGMWVEADCNLSGGESLARQFLLGRTFFREHFGRDAESPVLWLPDVFGYAWALPQLIRQAGLKYFMTIKIGWSQYNRLPYDTFLWQGIDGSQILTHFSTVKEFGSAYASTYNAMANARPWHWQNFSKGITKPARGIWLRDGGGGPTREMLENIEVLKDFPAMPQVRQSSAKAFFEAIEPLTESPRMPVWNGELYLEYHRGTYTTQARSKRLNRKSEFLLMLVRCSYASLITSTISNYCFSKRVAHCLPQPVPRHHPGLQHWSGLRRVTAAICAAYTGCDSTPR